MIAALAAVPPVRPPTPRATMVRWRGVRGSGRGQLRPDASMRIERSGGSSMAFLLEFDRAQERDAALRAKWGAYYRYYYLRQGYTDYPERHPGLLVVTIDTRAEDAIARTMREAQETWPGLLPAVLTTVQRIREAGSPLGTIWRGLTAEDTLRRYSLKLPD